MGKKYEIKPENVEGYVKHLEARLKKYRADASKVESHIRRIEAKLVTPEKSLLRDLYEGVEAVSKASGIPIPKRAKSAPGSGQTPAASPDLGARIDELAGKIEEEKIKKKDEKKSGGWTW